MTAGSGAAGGLGAGLRWFTPAQLRPGVEIVLDAVGFTDLLQGAAFVITGEGQTDFQTAFGKAPLGVAKAAKKFGVPVYCLSGGLGQGANDVLAHGIDALLSICDRPMSLADCMRDGQALIENATARLCRIIRSCSR
jgi:glycerate kinase